MGYLAIDARMLRVPVALLALCVVVRADNWQTIRDCRLMVNESNDGDSFHVEADNKERMFQLYFVDAPEDESGKLVADRIADQADEFGISEKEVLELGKKAAALTRAALSRPFKVITRIHNDPDHGDLRREYAFVETADGEDLGEMLVSRGLARSFGEDASTPTQSARSRREKYNRLEEKARRDRLGAWGEGSATPTIALPSSSAKSGDSGAAATPSPPLGSAVHSEELTSDVTSSVLEKTSEMIFSHAQPPRLGAGEKKSGKVSLNNATLAELKALPEVGPKTAQAIIDGRPYASVDEIDRIEGIGPKRLEAILPLVEK